MHIKKSGFGLKEIIIIKKEQTEALKQRPAIIKESFQCILNTKQQVNATIIYVSDI